MRKPIQDGFQSLIGTEAEVVSKLETGHSAKYLVHSQGELWSAYSADTLQPGETVNIVALKGIGVVVEQADKSHPSEIANTRIKLVGVKNSERHCH